MLGCPKEALEGLSAESFFASSVPQERGALLAAMAAGEPHDCDLALKTQGGERWTHLSSAAIRTSRGARTATMILVTDISDRIRHQQEREELLRRLSEKQGVLEDLLDQLAGAREEERRSIARELHDEIVPWLVGVEMNLTNAESKVQRLRMSPAANTVFRMREHLASAQRGCRDIIHRLRAEEAEHLGLEAALQRYADKYLATPVHWDIHMAGAEVSQEIAEAAFAIGREALRNASRHARCANIWVSLKAEDDALVLEVRDDGRGFEPNHALKPEHYGLEGMRDRARLVGGTVEVDSGGGHGTTVRFKAHQTAVREGPLVSSL